MIARTVATAISWPRVEQQAIAGAAGDLAGILGAVVQANQDVFVGAHRL